MKSEKTKKNEKQEVASPDRLDEYIRVTGTGTTVLIIALIVVFAAFIVWGFTGTIPVVKTMTGMVWNVYNDDETIEDGESVPEEYQDLYIICIIDAENDNWKDYVDKPAIIRTADGFEVSSTETQVSAYPISRAEAMKYFNLDWMSDKIMQGDYGYPYALIAGEEMRDHLHETVQVSVVVDEVRLISFLMQ